MLLNSERMLAKADAIGWSEDVCVDPAGVTGDAQMRLVHSEIGRSTTRVIRLVASPLVPRILPEHQNLSDGCLPVAILAMTRWITASAKAPGRCRLPPIGYATVSLRTKKIKGLHEHDFIVAVKLDRLAGKIAIAVADKQIEP
jgi:hypothetical protein